MDNNNNKSPIAANREQKKVVQKEKKKRLPKGRKVTGLEKRAVKIHRSFKSLEERNRNVPILRAIFTKNTQTPTLRLRCTLQALSSDSGGVIDDVIGINLNLLARASDWDDVFDEFRIVRGHFEVVPHEQNCVISSISAHRTMTGYVDYDDSTAAANKNSVWVNDTAKAWSTSQRIEFDILPDFVPDEQWYNSQTEQGTNIAWLKFYSDGCTASAPYSEIFGWLDVQFRQT